MSAELCDKCGGIVETGSWPFCNPAGGDHALTGWRARLGDLPVTIYRNAAGEVRFPGSASEPMPENYRAGGFERVEMTFHEARRFQKEFNRQEQARHSDKLEFQHYLESEEQSEDRSDLLHSMRSMSDKGREFAEYVIEQNNRESSQRYYSQDPGFYIEILES